MEKSVRRAVLCCVVQKWLLSVRSAAPQETEKDSRREFAESLEVQLQRHTHVQSLANQPAGQSENWNLEARGRARCAAAASDACSSSLVFAPSISRYPQDITSTYDKMTFQTLWYSHPRKFGKGSRQWYVSSTPTFRTDKNAAADRNIAVKIDNGMGSDKELSSNFRASNKDLSTAKTAVWDELLDTHHRGTVVCNNSGTA